MLKILLKHEILNLLKSRRVYLTIVMFLLLFATVFIVRVIDYQKQINQYIADVRLTEEQLQEAQNFSFLNPRAIKQPLIFSIYNEGFKNDRVINIIYYEPITHTTSLHTEKSLLSIESSQIDITFLITFFLSLFIFLIAYDSVNGEKRAGTLRIFMTYPIKRQSFILKKILGVFLLVAFTFTIPYIISLISLIIIYANLLTANFFLSASLYWFVAMLFIFIFSLFGVFISTLSTNPNRSLVYSLLVWFLFSIILPISWDYIAAPSLYDDKMHTLELNFQDKQRQGHRMMHIDIPPESNPRRWWWGSNSGYFYSATATAFHTDMYIGRLAFQRYMYETVFPVNREVEQIMDEIWRLRITAEQVRDRVFFFNPIVIFNTLSTHITGNSYQDHLRFLSDSRMVRDDLVNQGIRDGWLLDRRMYAVYADVVDNSFFNDLQSGKISFDEAIERFRIHREKVGKFVMELPVIRRYEQPRHSLGEIFGRILSCLVYYVICILVLWVMTWYRFMRYDVR